MTKAKLTKLLSVIMVLALFVTALPWTAVTSHAAGFDAHEDHAVLATPAAQVRNTATETIHLFNSGLETSQGKNTTGSLYSDAKNPSPTTYTNGGYDIYVRANTDNYQCQSSAQLGLSFMVENEVAELAILTVRAYDVDESSGEKDEIYLVDETANTSVKIGLLSGMDEQWNTTTFRIDKSNFTEGHTYHFLIKGVNGTWCVYVRNVSLQLTTYTDEEIEEPVLTPVITAHDFSATINDSGYVQTNLNLTSNMDVTYKLEYAATINSDQRGSALNQTINVTSAGVSKTVNFQLESGSPRGTYQIDVIVKDNENNVVATYTTTAGYAYSAVSYDSNGGSNNTPLDTTAYSSGSNVTVKFDFIPSRNGYTFLGWAYDSAATTPDFTENGTTSFTIGAEDVTLYAVWEEVIIVEPPVNPGIVDVWDGTIATSFGGGTGTQADPYLIYTSAQLAYLAQTTNAGNNYAGKYFKLMNNLDLNNIEWTPIATPRDLDIAQNSTNFSGTFDGDKHIVSNIKIRTSNAYAIGLFGSIFNAKICNLGVENVDYDISHCSRTGGLVGVMTASTVENCYSTGMLTFRECASSGGMGIGGLIGDMRENTTLINCYANCELNNYSTNTEYAFIGGLVGFVCNQGSKTISKCYSNSVIYTNGTSIPKRGGLIGELWCGNLLIEDCFDASIVDGVYTKAIIGSRGTSHQNSLTIRNSYYKTGGSCSYGGTSTDFNNFKSQAWIASTLGWNFNSIWAFDANHEFPVFIGFSQCIIITPTVDIWDGTVANGFGGGTGTEADPYLIYTSAQLAYLAQSTNAGNTYAGKYFKLMNNLDLNNIEWTPIGKDVLSSFSSDYTPTITFSGIFDGNYKTIYNLKISANSTSFAGLFGTTYNATIKQLEINNANVSNVIEHTYRSKVGALIGYARESVVEKCGVFNATILAEAVDKPTSGGGLIGLINGTTVRNSFAYANVSGNGHIAILIGGAYNSAGSVIQNCYAAGTVTSTTRVNTDVCKCAAGIMAHNEGSTTISNCVFIGDIDCSQTSHSVYTFSESDSTVRSCYYSTSSGNNFDIVNFKSQAWITSTLNWDFNNVWEFVTGKDYPVLKGFENGGPLPPHTHSYTSEVVAPTCTTDGYTEYTCQCGHTYRDTYVDNPGHVPGEWIIDTPATCTTTGIKHTNCVTCGELLDRIYIPATGHDIVVTVVRATTCTQYGIIKHACNNCSYEYNEYIYAEHNYQLTEHVNATCTVDGYDRYTCSVCNDSYDIVIPGSHNYIIEITQVATPSTDGLITYTCSICGDVYTEVIPARPNANVLLIQDVLPWTHNDNVNLLTKLKNEGYITGWDMTTTSAFNAANLANYNIVLIANDQTTATYNRLAQIQASLTEFANAGGVVIYGACDHGWSSGNISHALPGGVEKENYYSMYNYIVDENHAIVSGMLTDGMPLTNALLNGTYCSHTYFDTDTLPAGTNVIIQDAHGNPTLIEYAVGNGHIIASGLTWEFYYSRNSYAGPSLTYSKSVFDDLIVYAVYLTDACEHIYDEGTVVPSTCAAEGYTLHTCQSCGATMKTNPTEKLEHTLGEWVVIEDATPTETGLKGRYCTVCQALVDTEIIPIPDSAEARVESEDTVINGQTIDFYIVISNSDPIKSLAIIPSFDANVFEYVSGEWLVPDAAIQNIDPNTMLALASWNTVIDPNTRVYKFTLRAKNLTAGTTVSAEVRMEDESGIVILSVIPKTLSVITCPHATGTYTEIDDYYHSFTCDVCGHGSIHEHEFDDANDHICDDCGYFNYLPGDMDEDGDVDSDDAIYLLSYVMFGAGDYPIHQPGDLDNDTDVDSDDAIYLLYASFFGTTDYPLVH